MPAFDEGDEEDEEDEEGEDEGSAADMALLQARSMQGGLALLCLHRVTLTLALTATCIASPVHLLGSACMHACAAKRSVSIILQQAFIANYTAGTKEAALAALRMVRPWSIFYPGFKSCSDGFRLYTSFHGEAAPSTEDNYPGKGHLARWLRRPRS